jgi:phosphopantothenoylcysteine decarboxylase/phosphopantothenate--cysteine ligase
VAGILMGVTGGAAAFKAVGMASSLKKEGHRIDVIMTEAALEFVTPLQFSCITGRPVYTELFAGTHGNAAPHITLTEGIDLMLVAPATAHYIARAAHGLADDLLTAATLACTSPLVVAPSMNSRMWGNQATRANVEALGRMGVVLAGPVEGPLACGTTGYGRMMDPEDILAVCREILGREGA